MFAPGARVVRDKQDHFPVGFAHYIRQKKKIVGRDPMGARLGLARCRDCAVVLAVAISGSPDDQIDGTSAPESATPCPGCGMPMQDFSAYQPRGFRTTFKGHDYNEGLDAYVAPAKTSLGHVPSGAVTSVVGSLSVELLAGKQLVTTNDNRGQFFNGRSVGADSNVIVVNDDIYPPKAAGFVGKVVNNSPRPGHPFAIVDVLTTDILVLTPTNVALPGGVLPTNVQRLPAGLPAMTSFVQMFVRGCKDFLQIDENELKVGLQPFRDNGWVSQRIFIGDALENGSGYVRLIGEGQTLKTVLDDIVMVSGARLSDPARHPECDSSCPSCLRSYENRQVHHLLNWRLGLDVAELLAGGKMTTSRWLTRAQRLCAGWSRAFDKGGEYQIISLSSGLLALARADRKVAVVLGHPLWPQEELFQPLETAEAVLELQDDHGVPDDGVMVSDLYSLEFKPFQIWAKLQ